MKWQILIVDDCMTVRRDLNGALIAAGFDVAVCATKRSAEKLLATQTFDALVLDVMLPDGDGFEILKQVRTDAKLATTPVIMLSTAADEQARKRGLTMGADEYVGKPYNLAGFVPRLRELCHNGRTNKLPTSSVVGCRRILVVDNSLTFVEYMAQMLQQDGHDVIRAHSGKEALEMFATQTIDCIVIDLYMPELDGVETLRQLRQLPGRESTPALMLTASDDPADERNAKAVGDIEYLSKRLSCDVIRTKIRQLLREPHTESRGSIRKTNTWHAAPTPLASAPMEQYQDSGRAISTLQSSRPTTFSPVFVEAALVMGLNGRLAHDTLAKTLIRLQIDPHTMGHDDLKRALPAIRRTLGMFFSAEQIAARVDALTAIAFRDC